MKPPEAVPSLTGEVVPSVRHFGLSLLVQEPSIEGRPRKMFSNVFWKPKASAHSTRERIYEPYDRTTKSLPPALRTDNRGRCLPPRAVNRVNFDQHD